MEYVYQSTYGHAGGQHSAKPVFAIQNGQVFEMKDGKPDTKAVYAVRNNRIYATALHPDGASPHPLFAIRGNKIHTTLYHPRHNPSAHVFEVRSTRY